MNCYLCNSPTFTKRKGAVRDAPNMQVLECGNCGLVSLSRTDHIQSGFYENAGMHGAEPAPIAVWLKETERDDQRRFEMLKTLLLNKSLLDFGCGAAGFLNMAQHLAKTVTGIELELRVQKYWAGKLAIHPDIESAGVGYDLITAFHVIEHLTDPGQMLKLLATRLANNGRLVIEVPSSEDVLLTLYDCDAFQRFTYWSQHLYLFSAATLNTLATQAGLKVVAIQHYQRSPLPNHLYWLSQAKPGGHQRWAFLDTPELEAAYANALAATGKTDTLIAHLEKRPN